MTFSGQTVAGRHRSAPGHVARPVGSRAADATDAQVWRGLAVLCIGFFMVLVDTTIVFVANPALAGAFKASVTGVVWITSAYLLAYAVPIPITGRLGDSLGVRRIYLLGLAVFTLASLGCGLSGGLGALVTARVVQGLGASMMTPQITAYVTRAFPSSSRGRAMALWGATVGIATVVGPVLGGILLDGLGWRWIFLINVPVGPVAFLLALAFVPSLPTRPQRLDWGGVVLSAIGLFLVVYGIQGGHDRGWDRTTWLLIGAGVAMIAAWVLWEGFRASEPLMPLQLFLDRNFSVGNLTITGIAFSVNAAGIVFMMWGEVVRGMSATRSGMMLVPMALVSLVLARRAGQLADRWHPRFVIGLGCVIGAVGYAFAAFTMDPTRSAFFPVLGCALTGAGNAFLWAPNSAIASKGVAADLAGSASGVYNCTRQLGGVLGAAVTAVALEALLVHEGISGYDGTSASPVAVPRVMLGGVNKAFAYAMFLPAAALAVGLVAALLFERPASTEAGGGLP